MRTQLFDVSPVHKEIKVEIEPEEIRPVYQKVVQQYARLASIPGFRKGHAPVDVIKNRFRDDINNDVLRELLPERITQAIQENNLNPLSEPQLHVDNAENLKLNGSQPLALHVHVEIMPELEEPTYKGLEAVRRVRPVSDEDVDKMIQERRQEQASFVPIEDRSSQTGDTVTVDIAGKFVDEPEADPISVEDLQIELGSPNVQEEFTNNLLGVQPDATRTFTLEYPPDFTSPGLAGKKLEYTASVKSVGRVELPELNDEFARSLSEGETNYESLSDLRARLRQDLENYAKIESDNRLRDELMNKLIDANNIDVPPTLVNYQAQGLAQQFAQNMQQQGLDVNNLDQKLWQMLYQRMLPQATREVRGALLLHKIAEVENVEVSEDELNSEIDTLAKYSGRDAAEVREILAQQENGLANLRERLQNRKAIEVLVNNANVTDGEWIEEQEEQQQQAETASPEVIAEEQPESATEAAATEISSEEKSAANEAAKAQGETAIS